MTTSQTITQPDSHPKPKNPAVTALRPLIVDGAIPLGSYYLMRHFGVGIVPALALSSIFPAVDTIIGLVKEAAVSSTIGIALLVSAFAGRPLMTAGLKPPPSRPPTSRPSAAGP